MVVIINLDYVFMISYHCYVCHNLIRDSRNELFHSIILCFSNLSWGLFEIMLVTYPLSIY